MGDLSTTVKAIWDKMEEETKQKAMVEISSHFNMKIVDPEYITNVWIFKKEVPAEYKGKVLEILGNALEEQNEKFPRLKVNIPKENIIRLC